VSQPATLTSATAPGAAAGPSAPLRGLFLCCVHGLDARRIDPGVTPVLARLMAERPCVEIHTLPSTELLTTILTGVYPSEHGVWQVRLRPQARARPSSRLLDRLPDAVSTTLQGFRQIVEPTFDLALVPARRRRDFELHRFKYVRRERDRRVIDRIGGHPSLFGLLGARARFHFAKHFRALDRTMGRLPSGDAALEFLEVYALDLFQHWNLDRPDAVRRVYARFDRLLSGVRERCRRAGRTLLLVSDHGQERVQGTIPLRRELAHVKVPASDYAYFIEAVQARFWFRTADARRRLTAILRLMPHTRAFTHDQMERYHVPSADVAYGELHLVADPGWIFFPHDFHHPLANLLMALTHDTQRRRLLDPRHRGNHGYLPEHPSERGFAVLDDPAYRGDRPEIELIDLAPTVLVLLGEPVASGMRGRSAFARA
jgi:hypothetical protein